LTPFEVDHFIPRNAFKGIRDDLLEDYNNLVYACKKCNTAKSSKFSGDMHSPSPTNERFYNPREIDYNTIFYRNEYGAIVSDDFKGREMIKDLKLYRPIHIMGWICEELAIMEDKLDTVIENETDPERRALFQKARSNIAIKFSKCNRLFIAAYNDNDFSIESLDVDT